MASSFTGFCDALITDLTTEVPGLRDALPHRYAPYDPEQFLAEAGERHIGVWPSSATEESQPLVTGPGGDILLQSYQIAYWEHAGDEASRGYADEAAPPPTRTARGRRARLYAIENTFLGGAEHVRYVGAALPERSGIVRWFQVAVLVRTSAIVS